MEILDTTRRFKAGRSITVVGACMREGPPGIKAVDLDAQEAAADVVGCFCVWKNPLISLINGSLGPESASLTDLLHRDENGDPAKWNTFSSVVLICSWRRLLELFPSFQCVFLPLWSCWDRMCVFEEDEWRHRRRSSVEMSPKKDFGEHVTQMTKEFILITTTKITLAALLCF